MTGVKDDEGHDIAILLKDAASYLTEEFYICYYVYVQTENLGCFPFSGGWAEQPEWIVTAVTCLKGECAKLDAEEREEEKKKHQK